LIRCLAKQIPLLGDFVVSLPPPELTDVRRAGIQGARQGAADVAASMSAVVRGRLRGYVEQILRAMNDTRCEGLCRF